MHHYDKKYWNMLADILVAYCDYKWIKLHSSGTFRLLSKNNPEVMKARFGSYEILETKEQILAVNPYSDCYNCLSNTHSILDESIITKFEYITIDSGFIKAVGEAYKAISSYWTFRSQNYPNKNKYGVQVIEGGSFITYWHRNVLGAFIKAAHSRLLPNECIMHE
jgi:hypothetical protein